MLLNYFLTLPAASLSRSMPRMFLTTMLVSANSAMTLGDDHQVIEHIGQLPNQIVGGQGAQEDEHQRNNHVNLGSLALEHILNVDLAKQVPAENGGEGEEEQCNGNQMRSQAGRP